MRHYSLVFNTKNGSSRSMRINNPTVGLPLGEIENAVGRMITNDIFDSERGLESLRRMELVTMETTLIM